MQWEVTGADRASGAERVLTIDAPTAKHAYAAVRKHGLLIHSVNPVQPDYPAIVSGASWLRLFAALVLALGLLSILAGLVVGVLAAIAVEQRLAPALRFASFPVAMSCVGYGVINLGLGALLNMAGQIGLAVRDVARNSFSPPPPPPPA